MSPQRSMAMICDVTLMYSLELFFYFNGWETDWVDFVTVIYPVKPWISARATARSSWAWFPQLSSKHMHDTSFEMSTSELQCLEETICCLFVSKRIDHQMSVSEPDIAVINTLKNTFIDCIDSFIDFTVSSYVIIVEGIRHKGPRGSNSITVSVD